MLLQNEKKIVPGVGGLICAPAVDQDRAFARLCDLELPDKPCALHLAGRAMVIIVQSDLATGNDLRLYIPHWGPDEESEYVLRPNGDLWPWDEALEAAIKF